MGTYSFLKNYCRAIFYVGTGNFWYEENGVKKDSTIFYRLYQFVLFGCYISMTILEIMGVFLGDFPKDEHEDCVTFSMSHIIVLTKLFSVIIYKDVIKSLNKDMVQICAEYEEKTLMMEKYRSIRINLIAYVGIVYGTTGLYILEHMLKMFKGSHFLVVVAYYPHNEDYSPFATTIRVLMTFNLLMLKLTMIVSADSFAVTHLITFKYKFITLNNYFKDIRSKFDEESKTDLRMASDNLKNGVTKGIAIHAKLLSMQKQLDTAFGTVLAAQMVMSSGLAVALLLQLTMSKELSFVASMKILSFVFLLYFLLALFVCNAGQIAYQASLLPDSIFHCGWHLCDSNRRVGSLVYLSVMQAQRPLAMKAFKMIEMTYATFLQVVQMTYSVFALFYAQNQ